MVSPVSTYRNQQKQVAQESAGTTWAGTIASKAPLVCLSETRGASWGTQAGGASRGRQQAIRLLSVAVMRRVGVSEELDWKDDYFQIIPIRAWAVSRISVLQGLPRGQL